MGYGNFDEDLEEMQMREAGAAKHRKPTGGCCTNPKCGRARLVKGDDGKKRCTDCAWCVDDGAFDGEFARYLFT